MVQWLGLPVSTAGAQVQSLVQELRSHKLCNTTIKKRNRKPIQGFIVVRGWVQGDDSACTLGGAYVSKLPHKVKGEGTQDFL